MNYENLYQWLRSANWSFWGMVIAALTLVVLVVREMATYRWRRRQLPSPHVSIEEDATFSPRIIPPKRTETMGDKLQIPVEIGNSGHTGCSLAGVQFSSASHTSFQDVELDVYVESEHETADQKTYEHETIPVYINSSDRIRCELRGMVPRKGMSPASTEDPLEGELNFQFSTGEQQETVTLENVKIIRKDEHREDME